MADSTPPPKPFNIAIIGGGIAGLTLAISLLKHNIPITLYESASQFGEIGAGVGFESCMVRIMEKIDPRIKSGFLRCADWKGQEGAEQVWFTVRCGDSRKQSIEVGERLFDMPARPGPRGGVHRAHFLEELVKLVPGEVTRFRKRVVRVVEAGDGSRDVLLVFADGTEARHAAVVGCDGIKSRVREVVLGEVEARPVFTGKYAYRGLIPMGQAKEIMGEKEPLTPQMFVGYGGHVLTFPIAKGTILNVVAFSSRETWTHPEWVVQTSRDDMLADYAGWSPTVQAIMKAMLKPDIWALFDHPPARTYVQARPRICLVGDAAHATTPHSGAGAGMCVEDCYVLSELLGEVTDVKDLEKAFRAYDEVRRPRSQKLVKESREAGMLYDLEGPTKDDLEALEKNMKQRMDWLWDHDLSIDVEKARSIFTGSL